MADDYIVPFKVPTPGQSPYVKMYRHVLPNADLLILTPGYLNGVPQAFRLLELVLFFRASADVGNRTIIPTIARVYAEGGSGSVVFRATTGNIAATQAGKVVLSQYDINTLSGLTLDLQANVEGVAQLPDMILSGDDRVTIVTSGTFATDYYDIKVLAEYLNYKESITEVE